MWDVGTGNLVKVVVSEFPVWSVAWSPDSAFLATGLRSSQPKVWDAATGVVVRCLEGATLGWETTSIAWSPVGNMLAAGYEYDTVRVWDAATGTVIHTLRGHTGSVTEYAGPVNSVAWSPDGRNIAALSFDVSARLWEIAAGTRVLEVGKDCDRSAISIAWSSCGNLLFASTNQLDNGAVHIFSFQTFLLAA